MKLYAFKGYLKQYYCYSNVYAERKSIPNSSQVEMLHRAPSANLHARPCSGLEINICVDLAAYD